MEYALAGGVGFLLGYGLWLWGYYNGYTNAMQYATSRLDTLRDIL